MHEMTIMNRKGHETVTWDPRDTVAVKTAEQAFVTSLRQGSWAYQVKADGSYEQLTRFDPQAKTVMVMPPMAGG